MVGRVVAALEPDVQRVLVVPGRAEERKLSAVEASVEGEGRQIGGVATRVAPEQIARRCPECRAISGGPGQDRIVVAAGQPEQDRLVAGAGGRIRVVEELAARTGDVQPEAAGLVE